MLIGVSNILAAMKIAKAVPALASWETTSQGKFGLQHFGHQTRKLRPCKLSFSYRK